MLTFPNAKINIGLFVTEKRPDNYHNLESVFYPIKQLKDALEILPLEANQEAIMQLAGKTIEGNWQQNLVWRAYQLLLQNFPSKIPPVNIQLLKKIPMGAGLGGGSADATFMLKALNKMFAIGLSNEKLCDYALQLGSDCPFFVFNEPMLVKGRGEVLAPLSLDLSGYSILLFCPGIHIATSLAFSKIKVGLPKFDLAQLPQLSIEQWKSVISNDFENSVFEKYPELARLKTNLYKAGALYASMSGSGSAFYAIFEKSPIRPKVEFNLQGDCFYFE